MTKKRVRTPFYNPSISEGDIGAVVRVLSSGWLTTGPVTEAFEKAVAARLGVRHAVAVSSGTIGLQIALDIGTGGMGLDNKIITLQHFDYAGDFSAHRYTGTYRYNLEFCGSLHVRVGVCGYLQYTNSIYPVSY